MKEKDIYSIWAKQILDHDLTTVDGSSVRVIFPGNLSHERGADFKNAHIIIDDIHVYGDVEIHIKNNHWNQHKHQYDKNYNSVILHVVWKNDCTDVRKENGKHIPTLQLSDFYSDDLDYNLSNKHNCLFFNNLDKFQTNFVIMKCGMERIIQKANILRQYEYILPVEELLFQEIAKALGYPNNKLGMRHVYSTVKKQDLLTLNSKNIFNYCDLVIKKTRVKENNSIWNKFRIRPSSQPEKRIKEFVLLRWSYNDKKMSRSIVDIFIKSKNLTSFLENIKNMLAIDRFDKKLFFGEKIINIMVYNVFLTFILQFSLKFHNKIYLDKICKFIKEMPKIGNNHVTLSFENKLSSYQLKNIINKEVYYQGFHYLMNQYCCHNDCSLCKKHRDSILSL